ncbi:MAG: hypothetical protein LBP91_02930 [Coriobacteriales bacterium]|jgi:Tfp pilus assembly protein PilE|nr:hypothetical protein [Coriobacteriales bacterium]
MPPFSPLQPPRKRGTNQPPRSRAFFLEMLLNLLIFSLCAVVALQVYVQAKLVTDESNAITQLTSSAKDLAGHYKVSNGDLSTLLQTAHPGELGELSPDGVVTYYYDESFAPTVADNARYELVLTPLSDSGDEVRFIVITALAHGDQLFSFEVCNYQPQGSR